MQNNSCFVTDTRLTGYFGMHFKVFHKKTEVHEFFILDYNNGEIVDYDKIEEPEEFEIKEKTKEFFSITINSLINYDFQKGLIVLKSALKEFKVPSAKFKTSIVYKMLNTLETDVDLKYMYEIIIKEKLTEIQKINIFLERYFLLDDTYLFFSYSKLIKWREKSKIISSKIEKVTKDKYRVESIVKTSKEYLALSSLLETDDFGDIISLNIEKIVALSKQQCKSLTEYREHISLYRILDYHIEETILTEYKYIKPKLTSKARMYELKNYDYEAYKDNDFKESSKIAVTILITDDEELVIASSSEQENLKWNLVLMDRFGSAILKVRDLNPEDITLEDYLSSDDKSFKSFVQNKESSLYWFLKTWKEIQLEKIGFITDSTCDLDQEIVEKYDIEIVPTWIIYKNEEFRDRIEISADEVYDRFSTEIPKSSLPKAEDFYKSVENLKNKNYTKIICVSLSSGLSGTYNLFKTLAPTVEDIEVVAIDSVCLSMGLGFIILSLIELAKDGNSFDDIIQRSKKIINDTSVFFVLKTLYYLRIGGRIGLIEATVGEFLRLKPIITIKHTTGKYITHKKSRGNKKAIDDLVKIIGKHAEKPINIAVMHGNSIEEATEIVHKINKESFMKNIREVKIRQIGPVLSVHTGPGLFGVVIQKV